MKPRVHTSCVANTYAGPNERIVEFSGGAGELRGGGLISLQQMEDGRLQVCIYGYDPSVEIIVGHARGAEHHPGPNRGQFLPTND